MPLQSFDCVLRSRWWWGRQRRSSPGRWRGRRGIPCRRPWRRRSSPSDRDGSLPLWCCRQILGRHRSLLLPPRCSARIIGKKAGKRWSKTSPAFFDHHEPWASCISYAPDVLDRRKGLTFSAPQISTTSDSSTTVTRKLVVCISSFSSGPYALSLHPEV